MKVKVKVNEGEGGWGADEDMSSSGRMRILQGPGLRWGSGQDEGGHSDPLIRVPPATGPGVSSCLPGWPRGWGPA
jgi:hypothetical protein